jgi:hypothetical protein
MKYSRYQLPWLLENLYSIRTGTWPEDPKISPRDRQRSGHAYFEESIMIASELERRLLKCGEDGHICKAYYCWKDSPESIAKTFGISNDELEARVRAVLWYCSGADFKDRPYRRWLAKRGARKVHYY